jgi:hypothetical protein
MKRKLFKQFSCLSACLFILSGYLSGQSAQTDTVPNPDQFLFPKFSPGVVDMKTGNDLGLNLNYSIIAGKMVFIQKGKYCELVNPGSVDTIFLNHRKFIPVGKVFYEVLCETPFVLYAQHSGSILEPVKTDPYGRVSQASATTSIYNMKVQSIFYTLNDPEVKIKKETIYWMSQNNSMKSFKDAVQLNKLFPGMKSEIRDYIKQYKTEFGNPYDVVKLILFCTTLKDIK